MRPRRVILTLGFPALLTLSGCGYVHLGRAPAYPAPAPVVTDEKLVRENADLRLEKKMLQQELALTRAQGDALRMTIENRAADGDTSSKLVERLNQTTRELATLRASYAQLQADRSQAVASAAESNALRDRLAATENQLAESLRTYTELQGEVTRLRGEVERSQSENLVLTEKVKVITAESEEAQAALAQLNTELLAQKGARMRAEQDAATLRTELATVAPNASTLAQQRTGSAEAARSLVAEHEAETAALKQQLAKLRSQVDTLRVAEAKATTLAAENARLKSMAAAPASTPVVEAGPVIVGATSSASKPVVRIADLNGASGVNATLVTGVGGPRASMSRDNSSGQAARYHVVSGGDTLAKISSLYYGTPGRWGDILAANRDVLGETNNLVVGRTLRIP